MRKEEIYMASKQILFYCCFIALFSYELFWLCVSNCVNSAIGCCAQVRFVLLKNEQSALPCSTIEVRKLAQRGAQEPQQTRNIIDENEYHIYI